MTSSRGSNCEPASCDTTAWNGLAAERMKNGRSMSPEDAISEPSGATTATAPSWLVSANPDLTCWASKSAAYRSLAVLCSITSDDLVLERIDDVVQLMPLLGEHRLNLPQPLDRFANLVVGQLGETRQDAIVHDLVDQTTPGDRRKWGHGLDVLQAGLTAEHETARQDLRQGLENRPGLLAAATSAFKDEQVHATVKESSVIRDLGLDVLGGVPSTTDFVELEGGQTLEVLGLEDRVDAAPFVVHVGHVNNRPLSRWDTG